MKPMLERIVDSVYRFRLTVLLVVHVALIVLANQAAFWLRFDGSVPKEQQPFNTALLPLLILVRLATFLPLRVHEGVWRYASIWDLRNIVVGVILSSVMFWAIVHLVLGFTVYPRSVFIIDTVLLICLVGGIRLGRRLYGASLSNPDAKRVLIYGAGDAGEMIARDMLGHPASRSTPVGFLDDDPRKTGAKIHGIAVLGGAEVINASIKALDADEILIAMPSAEPKALRKVLNAVQDCNLPIRTLPRLREISSGQVSLNEIRDLSVADLLSRAPVGLDQGRIRRLIDGQVVLVTGAGGSIGSELCRQIAQAKPQRLVMMDRYENGLFAIHHELKQRFEPALTRAVIGDVTDLDRVDQVFRTERPAVVFHAAAHKHVPLMEENPSEAVKNNVRGTRLLSDAAMRWSTDRFVLISTDKAVNPTSVMGATKRLAERVIQQLSALSQTRFTVVRFGNVLGSNGSVVPTFLDQIRAGGPVTVTHPEMRRYFMLIPEAVQLVMHAAAIGERGGTYVLEMGEQVRLVDMARDLIRLAGYVPDRDIDIVFTGTRPGEKLYEELVGHDERAESSEVDKVQQVIALGPAQDALLAGSIQRLEQAATSDDDAAVINELVALFPSLGKAVAQR